IDVFYSSHDYVAQALGKPFAFLTNGKRGLTAACEGFAPSACAYEEKYFSKLRQYRWSPDWVSLGHRGGHFDYARLEFMEKMELPEVRPEERTPLVEALLGIIRQLADRVAELERINQELRDEIARSKGQKPRPDIKPSILNTPTKPADGTGKGRQRGKPTRP